MFKIFKDRYFWIILILTAGLGLFIYAADIHFLSWLPYQEEPHLLYMALERILFLLMVVIASWRFGFAGGLAVCLTVGFIAIPHIIDVFSFSSQPDMVIELIIVGVLGVTLSWLISVYELGKKRLRESYEQLEHRVRERTEELGQSHKQLEQELVEHKHTMGKLLQSEERYRALVDLSGEVGEAVVMLQDTEQGEGIQAFVSDQWLRVTGYSREELLGMPFFDLLHPECRQASIERHRKKVRGEAVPGLFEMTVIKKNGIEVPIELTSALTFYQGRPVNVAYIRDITKRQQAETTIKQLAYHDSLTGLPNRALFTDRINMALAYARRNKQIFAVMLLDLDKFKLVNDTYGHGTGDQLLKAVGNRIKDALRASDTVCRMGGDEFIVLLTNITDQEDVAKIANKISSLFQIPFVLDGNELHITSSIGVAVYPDNSEEADTLVTNADRAMYHSKVKGRNQWQLFTASMSEEHLLKE